MTNYVKSTNFASKDSLASGNPLKIVKGTEIDTEFNNIATAIGTKADTANPTFTGTPLAPTASAGTNTSQVATTAFVTAALSAYDTALTVSTAQIEDNAVTTAKILDANVTSAKLAASGVTAATYGSANSVPSFTVNTKGQITAASEAPLGFLRLIEKQSVYSGSPGNGATISVPLPTTLFGGETPSYVMFSASARVTGLTDMRYFFMCAGTDSIENIVLGSSSDDTDQGGSARVDTASTFVLPYTASQDFLTNLYGAALRISVIGYQL